MRLRRQFDTIAASSRRGSHGPVWVTYASTDDAPAVAFAIGRAVGSAVVRNRIRRRLRAQLDELDAAGVLAPGLYLVGVRPRAAGLDSTGLRHHLDHALGAVAS